MQLSLVASMWLLLLLVVFHPHVRACPYQASANRTYANNLPQSRFNTDRLPVTRSNQRHLQKRRRRRRLTVLDGLFPRLFLKFANLFDFLHVIPPPKPTSTSEAIALARERIEEIIDDNGGMDAKFVRLSFHDCVGGCDGCVDLTNPENFGLQQPIDALQKVVQRNSEFLTTADVWALAGLTAADVTQQRSNANFDLEFVQRPDCEGGNPAATKKGPDRHLPSAHLDVNGVLAFFNTTFGFTARETVAIMGGHTLGVADSDNSGFDGPGGWGPGRNRLDNNYYTQMLSNGRVNTDFTLELQDNTDNPPFPNQFMWTRDGRGSTFMFNADMALAVDLTGHVDPVSGNVNCSLLLASGSGNPVTCPPSPLLSVALEYAESNTVWVSDFRDVFAKMINTGCGKGVCQTVS